MKKALFATVLYICVALFVVGFTLADNSGRIPQVLSKAGLIEGGTAPIGHFKTFIDPTPEPRRPKLPK